MNVSIAFLLTAARGTMEMVTVSGEGHKCRCGTRRKYLFMKQRACCLVSVFGEEGIHGTIEKWKFPRIKAPKRSQCHADLR